MTVLLLFLVFLAPTIQYRVELRVFSFAVMEPVVLLASGVLLARALLKKQTVRIPGTWPEIGLIAIVAWAVLIRPWSQDGKHGLSDIRDWAIPVFTFLALRLAGRQDWRKAMDVFVIVIALTALIGIYQGFTGRFRPFMAQEANLKVAPGQPPPVAGFRWDPASGLTIWEAYAEYADLSEQGRAGEYAAAVDAASVVPPPFALGFFGHPNSTGMFLSAGFLLVLGWAVERMRAAGWLVSALVGLAFLLTYAETAYLVLACGLAAIIVLRRFRSLKAPAALVVVAVAAGALLLAGLPPTSFQTLAWRYGLWTTALALLSRSPLILLFGNGMDPYASLAYYFQPHNSYVYLLLEYGLLGLGLVLGVIASVAVKGWQDGRDGLWVRSFSLQALWIATLGFFAVGLTESVLLGIESRMIVLNFLACYLGLRRNVLAVAGTAPRPGDTAAHG